MEIVFDNLFETGKDGVRRNITISCPPDMLPMLEEVSSCAKQAAKRFQKMVSCKDQGLSRSYFAKIDLKGVSRLAEKSAEEFRKMFP